MRLKRERAPRSDKSRSAYAAPPVSLLAEYRPVEKWLLRLQGPLSPPDKPI